jgi:hypothetical protein
MNEHSFHQPPKIAADTERKMREWVREQEIEERSIHDRASPGACRPCSYITISREAGVSAGIIARRVGQILGWEVFDKNLLDRIADRFHLSRMMLDLVDETPGNWVYDVLGTWMDNKIIPHEKFVHFLTRVVTGVARRGKCVIVGRGARFILPAENGLGALLIASPQYRVEQIRQQQNLSLADARRWMNHIDQGRREFVRRFFHHNVDDPHLYDLVLNVEHLGVEGAAEEIVAAMNQYSHSRGADSGGEISSLGGRGGVSPAGAIGVIQPPASAL